MAGLATPQQIQSATAIGRTWIPYAGRAGYATKGVVYLIVGGLAAAAGWGAGGETTGSKGAISEIRQQPFGYWLLWLVAVGLAAYCLWRIVEAVTDPDQKGTSTMGILTRLGYLGSGLAHGLLAWTAAPISGAQPNDDGASERRGLVGWALSLPGGSWILTACGVAIAGYGGYQIYRGFANKFMDKYDAAHMSDGERKVALYSGKFGLMARGITFGVIGFFLALAGWTLDPSDVKGVGEALDVLARQSYGEWILLAVGFGLFCYGVFCLVQARYRRFRLGTVSA
ncbi:MAG: DUF1206 domain-containing protein [Planctomycetaceae bacterium]